MVVHRISSSGLRLLDLSRTWEVTDAGSIFPFSPAGYPSFQENRSPDASFSEGSINGRLPTGIRLPPIAFPHQPTASATSPSRSLDVPSGERASPTTFPVAPSGISFDPKRGRE